MVLVVALWHLFRQHQLRPTLKFQFKQQMFRGESSL